MIVRCDSTFGDRAFRCVHLDPHNGKHVDVTELDDDGCIRGTVSWTDEEADQPVAV